MTEVEPRGIGDNHPPEPTPFELAEKAVNDVYSEVSLWLDGHPIENQETADGVANLLALVRKAEAQTEEARKAEAKPFDDGKAEVQARYAPLIGNTKAIKGKTVLAAEALKAALAPWLDAERKRLDAEAAAKRAEADRLRQEAAEALRATDPAHIIEREAAEALLASARKAEVEANAAARETPTAGGALGRAAGLRTTWRATISDPVDAARSCWGDEAGREAMLAFLTDWANARVRAGVRSIPGFLIQEDRNVA